MKTHPFASIAIAAISTALVACGGAADSTAEVTETADGTMTYEEFLSVVYQEPSDELGPGVFVANGDEVFDDEAELRAYYDEAIAKKSELGVRRDSLIVDLKYSGADNKWSTTQRRNLTYCVSTRFGSRYNAVVSAMASATAAWEATANVNFVHDSSKDGSCTRYTTGVVFDVNPVNSGGRYLARAFFPDTSRSYRNILLDGSSFVQSPPLTLTGILRHELGHALGFRHEHTRPEAGACFEDSGYRALTTYDAASVMHYPHCNGAGDWSLSLTTKDKAGAKALYP